MSQLSPGINVYTNLYSITMVGAIKTFTLRSRTTTTVRLRCGYGTTTIWLWYDCDTVTVRLLHSYGTTTVWLHYGNDTIEAESNFYGEYCICNIDIHVVVDYYNNAMVKSKYAGLNITRYPRTFMYDWLVVH